MLIKNSDKNYSIEFLKKLFKKHVWVKRSILILFFILILIVTNLLSVRWGIDMQLKGKTHYLKRWGLTLFKKPLSVIPNYIDGLKAEPEVIEIDIKFKDYQDIVFQRELALKYGNKYRIHPENKGYVKAKINYKGEKYDIKIRLKGGQLDHWGHDYKWSYKIKMNGEGRILGMKYFSLQLPKTRSYMNEWVLHQMFKHEGIIGINYDFVELKINGESYGIYAIEENMDKILVERNSLREGVIINFNTDLMWSEFAQQYDFLYASEINTYSKVEDNSLLMKQYNTARTLLELYREQKLSADKVFDLEKFAKFFAIIDLTGNYHATALYNIKFYYNPITSLLEPIGYDNGWYIKMNRGKTILGANKIIEDSLRTTNYNFNWINSFFYDKEFYSLYMEEINRLCEANFLDSFFSTIENDFNEKLSFLHKSYPWYNHDGEYERISILNDNAKYIRQLLSIEKSLNVYCENFDYEKDSLYLQIANIFHFPVEIINVIYKDKIVFKPTKNIILQPLISKNPKYENYILSSENKIDTNQFDPDLLILNYRIFGQEKVLSEKINLFVYKVSHFLEIDFIRQQPNYLEFDFISVNEEEKKIKFKNKSIQLEKNLIIPKGYTVYAKSGTKIDLINSSKILTYSPIFFQGNEELPIEIFSSDSTGQGFIVMNAKQQSTLNYVYFNTLSSPSQADWSLPSSVTFYESPVVISFCRFTNNFSEDALNIFRSDFSIDNTFFTNTYSDAFDADFSEGTISDCDFINLGNDGIDVSGGLIEISNVNIENAGDKGVSAGENSKININNLKCINSEIAVASKDKSTININNITISDCKIGFTAFQKKPEFDIATINVWNLLISKTKINYLIEENSIMKLENRQIKTSNKNVKQILYGNEYGKSTK